MVTAGDLLNERLALFAVLHVPGVGELPDFEVKDFRAIEAVVFQSVAPAANFGLAVLANGGFLVFALELNDLSTADFWAPFCEWVMTDDIVFLENDEFLESFIVQVLL